MEKLREVPVEQGKLCPSPPWGVTNTGETLANPAPLRTAMKNERFKCFSRPISKKSMLSGDNKRGFPRFIVSMKSFPGKRNALIVPVNPARILRRRRGLLQPGVV
jgi:hypothetical protein